MLRTPIILLTTLVLGCDITKAYNKERLLQLRLSEHGPIKKALNYHEDIFLNYTERSAKYGYSARAHEVTTEDGYILTMFRMLQRPHCVKLRSPPVLLQHGLFVNSITWLDAGPKAGLPYLLADACFDVWCGNTRGTEFSRNHTELNPNTDPEYWQFSFHEVGIYDLPVMIDFILKETESLTLSYIGHSQGCNAAFVLGCTKPAYMSKLNVIVAMAPAMRLKNAKNFLYKFFAKFSTAHTILDTVGVQEVLHRHSLLQEFLHFLCRSKRRAKKCAAFLYQLDGLHEGSITSDTLSLIFAHVPDGVSLKNADHFMQILRTGEFRYYDYKEDNLKVYGSRMPPLYDIKNIEVPVQIIYGENDFLVNASDVRTFGKKVSNLRGLYQIEDLRWNHLDFIWSSLIPKYLYPKIEEILDAYSYSSPPPIRTWPPWRSMA